MVSMTENSAGDTVTYTCDDGYDLIGTETITCTSDGTWSDEPPMCGRKGFHHNESFSQKLHRTQTHN